MKSRAMSEAGKIRISISMFQRVAGNKSMDPPKTHEANMKAVLFTEIIGYHSLSEGNISRM